MKSCLLLFSLFLMTAAGFADEASDLIAALGDADAAVRREAARSLGTLRDARAVKPLIKALRDKDVNVRFYAAYAFGELKDPSSADALLAALSDPVWGVRDHAAWALRELHDPKLIPALAGALSRPNADIAHIMWILEHMDAAAMIAPLEKLLRHPREDIRLRAVELLAEPDDPGATKALTGAFGDPAVAIRRRVVAVLLEKRNREALAPLAELARSDKDESVRTAAAAAVQLLTRHAHLAAHWSFDDRSTTTARDSGGRGVNGEIKGCKVVEGKTGHALRFGKGAYVKLGRPAKLPVQGVPFTVMAWARSEQPNGVVVARGGAFQGYSLYLKGGAARFGIHLVEEGPAYIAAGKENVTKRWGHLAGVVHETRIELYVDGKLAATAKTAGYLPGNCGQGMEIGFDVGNSPTELVDNFVGTIDEVRVYEAALPAEEIRKEAGMK